MMCLLLIVQQMAKRARDPLIRVLGEGYRENHHRQSVGARIEFVVEEYEEKRRGNDRKELTCQESWNYSLGQSYTRNSNFKIVIRLFYKGDHIFYLEGGGGRQ